MHIALKLLYPVVLLAAHFVLAIPLYFLWNALAPKFFYWLPLVYQQLGFLEIVGLSLVVALLRILFFPDRIDIKPKV